MLMSWYLKDTYRHMTCDNILTRDNGFLKFPHCTNLQSSLPSFPYQDLYIRWACLLNMPKKSMISFYWTNIIFNLGPLLEKGTQPVVTRMHWCCDTGPVSEGCFQCPPVLHQWERLCCWSGGHVVCCVFIDVSLSSTFLLYAYYAEVQVFLVHVFSFMDRPVDLSVQPVMTCGGNTLTGKNLWLKCFMVVLIE